MGKGVSIPSYPTAMVEDVDQQKGDSKFRRSVVESNGRVNMNRDLVSLRFSKNGRNHGRSIDSRRGKESRGETYEPGSPAEGSGRVTIKGL
jgi:hypothetical protein